MTDYDPLNVIATKGTLRPTYQTPWSDYPERVGQTFSIIRSTNPNDSTKEYDKEDDVNSVGPLFLICFEDGLEVIAWPEEIYSGISSFEPEDTNG